jgi:hypothetical protein
MTTAADAHLAGEFLSEGVKIEHRKVSDTE